MIRPAETLSRVGLAVIVPVGIVTAFLIMDHLWKWSEPLGAFTSLLAILAVIGSVAIGAALLTWRAPLTRDEVRFALTRYTPLALVFLVVYAFFFACAVYGDCL
jgi:hypothetical protein